MTFHLESRALSYALHFIGPIAIACIFNAYNKNHIGISVCWSMWLMSFFSAIFLILTLGIIIMGLVSAFCLIIPPVTVI